MNGSEFFKEYLIKNNLDLNTEYNHELKIGLNDEEINNNANLICDGKMKIIINSLLKYPEAKYDAPKEGDINIILDANDNPKCITKTNKVRILLFKNIDFETAKLEGKVLSYAMWQKEKMDFFDRESQKLGYKFEIGMSVIIEEIEVIYRG